MIGILGVGAYIPELRERNFDKIESHDVDPDFIREKLGVTAVARAPAGLEPSDMCVKAWSDLDGARSGPPPDCIIVCTQNPDGEGLPHTSAAVHAKLGVPDSCACFDISLGCSGYVYGLSIITAFMAANRLKRGVLFTADPYSRIIDPDDRATALLFGDAATATLIGPAAGNPDAFVAGPFLFATRGEARAALERKGGRLRMNGRAVFNFCATEVPRQISALLAQTSTDPGEIDAFILHQGSRFIIDQITRRLGVPGEKVPLEMAEYGNTVSSSIPLMLRTRIHDPRYRRLLLSGFGVGLSWASCLLNRA